MLDRLSPKHGSRRARTRKGRGMASGSGRTCGRGQKGAGARSGHKKRPWFEGGQMPLARRLPKRGFTNIFRDEKQVVNVRALEGFKKGDVVDVASLCAAGLVSRADRAVKVLGDGDLKDALVLKVDAISAVAREKVEAAGGSVELVKTPKRAPATPPEGASS